MGHFKNKSIAFFLAVYRGFFSPLLHLLVGPGMGCRFQPTCSEYFADSVKSFGFIRGGIVGTKRLCSCHPLSRRFRDTGGWDPVELATKR